VVSKTPAIARHSWFGRASGPGLDDFEVTSRRKRVTALVAQRPKRSEWVARNRWTICPGFSGRFRTESVVGFRRITQRHHPPAKESERLHHRPRQFKPIAVSPSRRGVRVTLARGRSTQSRPDYAGNAHNPFCLVPIDSHLGLTRSAGFEVLPILVQDY